MSVLVEQQDETIQVIETQAQSVEKDTEVGYVGQLLSHHLLTACIVFNIPRRLWSLRVRRAKSDGSASSSASSFSSLLLSWWLWLSSKIRNKIDASLVIYLDCSYLFATQFMIPGILIRNYIYTHNRLIFISCFIEKQLL
jgi:hypothetical protein